VALGIFLLALAVRVLYVLALRDHPRFDAPIMDPGYHLAWARSMAEGVEFQSGPFFRAPLYPMALAAMLKCTGGSLLGVRLIQAVLGAATAALTYRLGARVAGEGAGRIAGIVVATAWTLVAFDAELLIPVLLLPILLAALELTVIWRERAAAGVGGPLSLLVGVLFGLAAIARPNVLLYMPVLFFGALLWFRQARPAVWLTLGTLLPIVPVTVHNVLEGDGSLIATQGGVNFWIGNNPSSDGSAAIVPGTRDGWWEGYFDSIALAEADEGRELKATEVSAHYRAKALNWMSSEPGNALAHLLSKGRLLFANAELANNQDMRFLAFHTLPALRYSPARWAVLFGLGAVGLALLCFGGSAPRRRGGRVITTFAVVYAASVVLFFVNARFRLPLVPILSIGSGALLMAVVERLRARHWAGAVAIGLPALALSALSFIDPAGYASSDGNGLAELGKAELDRGDPEAALRYLDQAVAANPNSVQVRMALATAIVAAKRDPERALLLLREAKALPRGKDFPELDVQILDTRLSAGDVEGALRDARLALRSRPKDGALRFVVARGEALSGSGSKAVRLLQELLADEPTNATVALVIAQVLEKLPGRREEAASAYERVISMGAFASPSMLAQAQSKLAELQR
jgi:4-amino-4-deoxy-L-arabinose transferase-like glycosyltransferase